MFRQIATIIALLASSAFISFGHGALSALLLNLGGSLYQFSDVFLGALVSVMYFGFIVGNYVLRYLLPRVSYIRTFSVCAALTTVGAMLLPVLPTAAAWIILRFVHGLFFSTSVVICDGWLNASTKTEVRSRLMSVYMIFNYVAFGLSQYILLVGDALAGVSFSVAAMFVVFSLVPICLTRFPEPQSGGGGGGEPVMSLRKAYQIAPIAMVGQFAVGLINGASWLFVRYAEAVTSSVDQVSNLSALFFGSGFLMQYPIGWLSDRVKDRRTVISAIYAITTVLAVVLFFGGDLSYFVLVVFVLLFGSISVTSYALNIAYGQDFVEAGQSAEYSSRIFQSYALGALVGPALAGALMEYITVFWLFVVIACAAVAMTVLSFTEIVMPRLKPSRGATFKAAFTPVPTIADEGESYSELDVGPDLPVETATAEAEEPPAVGPMLPESHDVGEGEEEHVGPFIPDDYVDDTDDEGMVGPSQPDD